LYEKVFYETLGMSSAAEVVALYGEALAASGLDPAEQRVLDFGAGNGMAGERIAALGVRSVVGLDLEPAARDAAGRDRPGVYEDSLVADLGALPVAQFAALRARRFTAVLAVASVGVGHIPPSVLGRALDLLEPGGLFAFPISVSLLPDSADESARSTGYPAFFAELFADGRAEKVAERAFNHRRSTDGSDHPALAVVGRIAG
jgi:SAM-dependent methyltransferase